MQSLNVIGLFTFSSTIFLRVPKAGPVPLFELRSRPRKDIVKERSLFHI